MLYTNLLAYLYQVFDSDYEGAQKIFRGCIGHVNWII